MQHRLSGLVSRVIAVLVGLIFCLGGAALIYNEARLKQERAKLDVSGVEAVATVTGNAIEFTSGSPPDTYHDITYTFPDQAGAIWSGETRPYTDTGTLFEAPTPGARILDADLVAGDQILVTYLPDDPSIHRTIEDCTGCDDLGSFGDNMGTYVGLFLVLIGAWFLYALFRRGLTPSP